jgi:hypothetical protein
MRIEWWWSAYGVLVRNFQTEEEAHSAIQSETNPVIFVTGEGWDIQIKKSEITVISRTVISNS